MKKLLFIITMLCISVPVFGSWRPARHSDNYLVKLLYGRNDSDTYLGFNAADAFTLQAGGEEFIKITEDGTQDIFKIGDNGDIDFIVGDSWLFVEGSTGYTGFGTNDPNTLVDIDGNGEAENFYTQSGPVVNVCHSTYGADPTGVADSTAAIQAAIDAASAGDVIYFPPGNYLISTTLTLASNKSLQGEGYGSKIITATASMDLITCSSIANLSIKGLRLEGADTGTGTPAGILIDDSIRIQVEDCWIEESYFGIMVDGSSSQVMISNCVMYENLCAACRFDSSANQCLFTGNDVFNNDTEGVHIDDDATEIVVSNNNIYHNGNSGVRIEACYRCSVTGNVIRNNGANGINIYKGAKYNTITSNTLYDNCIPFGYTTSYGTVGTTGVAGISTGGDNDYNVISSNVCRASSSSTTTIHDAETNWTSAANVTCATDASVVREGSNSVKTTIADAFTTGQCCYIDCTDRDLSSVSSVSFWLYADSDTYDELEFAFYSDDTATTEIASVEILVNASRWEMVNIYIDSDAGWSSVKAVGFKVQNDVGADKVFYVDKIRYPARQHYGILIERWGYNSEYSEYNQVIGNTSTSHEIGEIVDYFNEDNTIISDTESKLWTGGLGINTSDPNTTLDVDGTAQVENLIVDYDIQVEDMIVDKTSTDVMYPMRSVIKTIDFDAGGSTDFKCDNTQNNATEQPIDCGELIPAGCSILSVTLQCDETVAGSGSAVMSIDVGTTTGDDNLLTTADVDSDNDISVPAAGTWPLVAPAAAAQHIWVNFTPTANWDTLSAGQWSIYVLYDDYAAVRAQKGL